ncbi:AmmeMemoRadiSam system radical SAM enzyme [Salinispira pacifica]
MVREAMCWRAGSDGAVQCYLCAHRCVIRPGQSGVCMVRQNLDGTLVSTVYGDPIALHVDPIEKKPLYHFLPGTLTFSVATVGCNFRCAFCQNWQISQRRSNPTSAGRKPVAPEELVRQAQGQRCPSISYTYTEPTIFFEYAYDTARIATDRGLKNIFVTNGFMSEEALKEIEPYLDAANVDLKSFSDRFYRRQCKGRLNPVLDTIRRMKERGIWVEVTTLIVPRENDSREELEQIAGFLASISREIPWHVTRFHPDYKMTDRDVTPRDTLDLARSIGSAAGLRSVHVGNVL